MVLMKPHFSAQVEAQLFAREHRLGQQNDVRVYRLFYPDVSQEKANLGDKP